MQPFGKLNSPTGTSTPTKSNGGDDDDSKGSNNTPKGGGHTPITICHATGSASNPYVRITVDDDGLYSGHIYDEDDIIPAPAGGCPEAEKATKTPKANGKITICHATSSELDPYSIITVADDGIYNGHIHHEDDIIPAPASGCPRFEEVAAIDEIVDRQLKNSMRSNIAFISPESMKQGDSTIIELYLNPSSSQDALATEITRGGSYVTSTAEPGQLVGLAGEEVAVETVNIEITNRMKATLVSLDPEAFVVQELHDSAEQAISAVDSTIWRWSITAKTEGTNILVLTLFRLIITSNGSEYWREVESYKTSIAVDVSPEDRIKSLDWKWIIGIIVSALLIPAFWRWFDSRKKEPSDK